VLGEMNPTDAMELLVNRLSKTKTNTEFLMSLKS
jgi:transcription termination factor Rho